VGEGDGVLEEDLIDGGVGEGCIIPNSDVQKRYLARSYFKARLVQVSAMQPPRKNATLYSSSHSHLTGVILFSSNYLEYTLKSIPLSISYTI
jgi:hypothetical protein